MLHLFQRIENPALLNGNACQSEPGLGASRIGLEILFKLLGGRLQVPFANLGKAEGCVQASLPRMRLQQFAVEFHGVIRASLFDDRLG